MWQPPSIGMLILSNKGLPLRLIDIHRPLAPKQLQCSYKMNRKNPLNAVHFIVLYSISIVPYHVGCLGLPNWSEQNMIRRCLSLLMFKRNDEDYRDNMKTITHHIRILIKMMVHTRTILYVRYTLYLHVYTSCISLPRSPIYMGECSFILSHRSPLSTHIFLRKQVLIFKKVQFIQSPLFLKFIHPCDDNQPNWSHLSLFNIPSIDYGSLALGLHETDEATNEDHSCKPRQLRFNMESLELSRIG